MKTEVKVTKCPTAYCAPTRQGQPVSLSDQAQLEQHFREQNAKSDAAAERQRQRMFERWGSG